eukprot:6902232-Pyramimonas_sp.AAC.1
MSELGQVLHGEQDVWSRAAGYPEQLAKESSKGELGVHLGVLRQVQASLHGRFHGLGGHIF